MRWRGVKIATFRETFKWELGLSLPPLGPPGLSPGHFSLDLWTPQGQAEQILIFCEALKAASHAREPGVGQPQHLCTVDDRDRERTHRRTRPHPIHRNPILGISYSLTPLVLRHG